MVKQCVGPIDFFFLALCFLSARNDIDSKYKELCNFCADLIRIQGLITLGMLPVSPTTNKETNEGLDNVRTVTSSLHSNEGITPLTR